MRVAGIDPSLSRTGLWLPTGARSIEARRIPKGDLNARAGRLVHIVSQVLAAVTRTDVDLVVLEGYSLGGQRGYAAAYSCELGGTLRAELAAARFHLAEVPPSTLKKYATGSGKADKQAMVAAARTLGAEVANDDEADAFFLALWGIEHRWPP